MGVRRLKCGITVQYTPGTLGGDKRKTLSLSPATSGVRDNCHFTPGSLVSHLK